MLGWIQKVLPQPPGTPQKINMEEEEAEEEAELEPELELELEPEPLEEPVDEEQVTAADSSLQALQAQVAVSPDVNSPSGWVLTWLRKGMEKVLPQPVCNGRTAPIAAGTEAAAQAGAQILEHCGPGNTGSADESSEAPRVQDARTSLWLLRWLEQNLDKVLPQPPKSPKVCTAEPIDAASHPEPAEPLLETEPTPPVPESSEPADPPLETEPTPQVPESSCAPHPEEEPAPEPQPSVQASAGSPPGDSTGLLAWILPKLEKALPQPVLRGKTREQEPEMCDVQTRVSAAGGL